MTDDDGTPTWPPTPFDLFQGAGEQAVEQQRELFEQMMDSGTGGMSGLPGLSDLSAMTNTATFKTRVQSGGRISIPDAEREALDIEEGDIVQTVVVPVKRNRDED